MSALLPPSRLLAATIAVTALALILKTVDLVTSAPTMTAFLAGTTEAMEVAGATRMIGQAYAAPAEVAQPNIPHTSTPVSPQPAMPVAASTPTPATTADAAAADAAQDVKLGHSPTEDREARLTEREAALAAEDKHVTERVAELQAIQGRLEALEADRKSAEEANWGGLVKLYEGMRPRDAAVIFNGLDKPVLLELLDRMKPGKASPVIALMEPNSARQITADLAAKRTHATTVTN